MKILLIIFTWFIVGCGQAEFTYVGPSLGNNWEQDADFAEHIHDFIFDAGQHEVNLTITNLHVRFAELTKPVVGRCYLGPGIVIIEIDPTFWQENDGRVIQQILMYHELGHCILRRDHETNTASLMAPMLLTPLLYTYYRGYYLEELFDTEKFNSLKLMSFLGDTADWFIE